MKKLWVLSSVLLLAACGGGDNLSKSAVQKAVNASVKSHAVCVPFQLTVDTRKAGDNPVLGSPEVKLVKRQDNGKRANLTAIDQMEVLTDAGLYRRDKEQREGEGVHRAARRLQAHFGTARQPERQHRRGGSERR